MSDIRAARTAEVLEALEARKGLRFTKTVTVVYNVLELSRGRAFSEDSQPVNALCSDIVELAGFQEEAIEVAESVIALRKALRADAEQETRE